MLFCNVSLCYGVWDVGEKHLPMLKTSTRNVFAFDEND